MLLTWNPARRIAVAACGALAVGLAPAGPAWSEPPPPNCTAADLTGILAGVSAATSAYLFTHPPVNDFFTSLGGKPREERRAAIEQFMTANPQVRDELRAIRQPAKDFRDRCGG
ncbi:heme-binding protein [Mycobacterium sp. NPDC003323]